MASIAAPVGDSKTEDTVNRALQRIFKTQIGQKQAYLFQKGDMPFGLGDGLALAVAYVWVEPEAILKLHRPGGASQH
jgi:hypothetical protein